MSSSPRSMRKRTIKSIVRSAVIGAGLLVATSVFAHDHDHDRGRDRDDHRGWAEHHDRDRHDFGRRDWDNRWDRHDHGGPRFVIPLPPPPPFFIPHPHVTFSVRAPDPVYVTYANVIDVDPIIIRVRSRHDWDRDFDGDDRANDYREQIDGYRVTYVFRGREYTTRMAYDPGSRVRIRVGDGIEVIE